MSNVDVLIVAALPMEYEAAKQMATFREPSHGVRSWEERDRRTPTPYLFGEYVTRDGRVMTLGLAYPVQMGGRTTGPFAMSLVQRLQPKCLAMCGVCAGNPARVALGDVIFATLTYEYDEGKALGDGIFVPDIRQFSLSQDWIYQAQSLQSSALLCFSPPDKSSSKLWFLKSLDSGSDPVKYAAFEVYFPANRREQQLRELLEEKLIIVKRETFALTSSGKKYMQKFFVNNFSAVETLPFSIAVGPLASGSAVVSDGTIWSRLDRRGVRSTLGIEMEAATISTVAAQYGIPWAVAKGVMDHADDGKSDKYKLFAARASAEVLLEFLASQKWGDKSPPEVRTETDSPYDDSRCSTAYRELIECLFDGQYYIPTNPVVSVQQIYSFLPDEVWNEIRGVISLSRPISELIQILEARGFAGAALSHLVNRINADWQQLRPYAKIAILDVAARFPAIGLGPFPPLSRSEREVAAIQWYLADAVFKHYWDVWIGDIRAKGWDYEKDAITWESLADDVRYYTDRLAWILEKRIEVDLALTKVMHPSVARRAGSYAKERVEETYLQIIERVNRICLSYPNQTAAMKAFSQPMRECGREVLDATHSIVPPTDVLDQFLPYQRGAAG